MNNYSIKLVFDDAGKKIVKSVPAVEENYGQAVEVAYSLVRGYCELYKWRFCSMEVKDVNANKAHNET